MPGIRYRTPGMQQNAQLPRVPSTPTTRDAERSWLNFLDVHESLIHGDRMHLYGRVVHVRVWFDVDVLALSPNMTRAPEESDPPAKSIRHAQEALARKLWGTTDPRTRNLILVMLGRHVGTSPDGLSALATVHDLMPGWRESRPFYDFAPTARFPYDDKQLIPAIVQYAERLKARAKPSSGKEQPGAQLPASPPATLSDVWSGGQAPPLPPPLPPPSLPQSESCQPRLRWDSCQRHSNIEPPRHSLSPHISLSPEPALSSSTRCAPPKASFPRRPYTDPAPVIDLTQSDDDGICTRQGARRHAHEQLRLSPLPVRQLPDVDMECLESKAGPIPKHIIDAYIGKLPCKDLSIEIRPALSIDDIRDKKEFKSKAHYLLIPFLYHSSDGEHGALWCLHLLIRADGLAATAQDHPQLFLSLGDRSSLRLLENGREYNKLRGAIVRSAVEARMTLTDVHNHAFNSHDKRCPAPSHADDPFVSGLLLLHHARQFVEDPVAFLAERNLCDPAGPYRRTFEQFDEDNMRRDLVESFRVKEEEDEDDDEDVPMMSGALWSKEPSVAISVSDQSVVTTTWRRRKRKNKKAWYKDKGKKEEPRTLDSDPPSKRRKADDDHSPSRGTVIKRETSVDAVDDRSIIEMT